MARSLAAHIRRMMAPAAQPPMPETDPATEMSADEKAAIEAEEAAANAPEPATASSAELTRPEMIAAIHAELARIGQNEARAQALEKTLAELRSPSAAGAAVAVPGLLATLRPYQLAGVHWLRFLTN